MSFEELWTVIPLELGAGMLAKGSGVAVWPVLVTVALLGLVPEYRIPPERSSVGAVIEGELEARIDDDELESTMMLPPTAVTDVVPESETEVPDGLRTRMAAVEYGVWDAPIAVALAVADIDPDPQIALKYRGLVEVIDTAT
jgi:hypothetical protein